MNDLELKYYNHPEMQKLFRERMGEWKAGDRYHCPNDNPELFHKAKIIKDGYFDSMKYDSEGKLGSFVNPEPCCPDVCIRLPLPIDQRSPERGLAGMVSGTWMLQKWGDDDYELTIREDGDILYYTGKTSTLVLLKALAYQIGAEVKG